MEPKAKIIAHSVGITGVEMITFELEYHRMIHSEFMTHRMLSKNASSSRAIPVKKAMQHVIDHPAMPVYFGKNQSGMQANEELTEQQVSEVKEIWLDMMNSCAEGVEKLIDLKLHKQLSNRPLEAWSSIKVVCSATEWDNFFWLRLHKAAQPEIVALANEMKIALDASKSTELVHGQWHLPYVNNEIVNGKQVCYNEKGDVITIEQARILSASCCAQVSYRKLDDSQEKAESIYKKLIESDRVHASPVEHQATPIPRFEDHPGITHICRDGSKWSGNLREWIQFRKLIPNESK